MQPDSENWSDALTAVLNCLIPGDAALWPAAGDHGIGPRVVEFLQQQADGINCIKTVCAACGSDFCHWPRDRQTSRLRQVETDSPDAFERLLVAIYNMYYTDPDIRRIIERVTGYEARPPQPLGYEMEPFDESLLDTVRRRKPFWRRETDH